MATREELEKRIAELEEKNRQAEQTIRENQKMFQLVIDTIPQFITWKDTDCVYLGCNKNLAQVAGLENPEDIMGKTDYDLAWTKEESDAFVADDHAVMDSNTPKYHIIEPQLQADGKKAWLDTNKIPLHDDNENVIGVLVTFEDITERKQMEEALQEERNILRTVIDIIPDYIFVKDAESQFMLNNAAHLNGMGATHQDDVVGKTDLDIYPQELAENYYADDQNVIKSGQPLINREEPVVDQTMGETRWVSVTKVPLLDSEDKVVGLVGIARDITERKLSEEEREQLQQEIIEAQQHSIRELSTPVIPIMDRIIVMPMVGNIDSLRARDVTRSLLAGIGQHRAKIVLLDVTGVSLMDTGIVNHLNKTIQAARLKGAETIVTGVSDAVAESIVDLGIDWSAVTTLSDLQTGLLVALDSLGVKLSR